MKHLTGLHEGIVQSIEPEGYNVIIPMLGQMEVVAIPLHLSSPTVGTVSVSYAVGDLVMLAFYNMSMSTALILGASPKSPQEEPALNAAATDCNYMRYGTAYVHLDENQAALIKQDSALLLKPEELDLTLPQAQFIVNNKGFKHTGPLPIELTETGLKLGVGADKAALAQQTLQAFQAVVTALTAIAPFTTDPASAGTAITTLQAQLTSFASTLPSKDLSLS